MMIIMMVMAMMRGLVVMHDNRVVTIPHFNPHSSSKIMLMEIMMTMMMMLMMMTIIMVLIMMMV